MMMTIYNVDVSQLIKQKGLVDAPRLARSLTMQFYVPLWHLSSFPTNYGYSFVRKNWVGFLM